MVLNVPSAASTGITMKKECIPVYAAIRNCSHQILSLKAVPDGQASTSLSVKRMLGKQKITVTEWFVQKCIAVDAVRTWDISLMMVRSLPVCGIASIQHPLTL